MMCEQRPGNASILVGQRNNSYIFGSSVEIVSEFWFGKLSKHMI